MSTSEAIAAYEGTAEAAREDSAGERRDCRDSLDQGETDAAKVPVIVGEIGRWMRNDGDRYYEAWKSVAK